jgi:hypothetical protein
VTGHPLICRVSANLGSALINAYTLTHGSEYLDKAVDAFRASVSCQSAPASARFIVARSWASHVDSNHKSALEAYHAAIELLPRIAMLGLDLQSRQQALTSGSDGLACDAAFCVIRSNQYDKAVELLEEGRVVFWAQALQLRKPISNLRDAAPELEERLRRISLALEQGSFRDTSRSLSDTPQKVMVMEQEASHFHLLNDQWMAALEEVRQLDGFHDFLRPHRLATLQHAAVNGPVAILIASKTACAALVLKLTGVRHVPLPDLSLTEVTILVKLICQIIAQDGRGGMLSDPSRACVEGLIQQMPLLSGTVQQLRRPFERHVGRASDTHAQPDDLFRYILALLWELVVEPIIQSLDLKVNWLLL